MKILDLKVGDRVRDTRGGVGKVCSFSRDHVMVRYDDGSVGRYTDEGLALHSIAKVSPFDDEDTEPGFVPVIAGVE